MAEEMRIQDMSNEAPGFRPSRQEVYDFLLTQKLGVLATLGPEGQPQAATVAFSTTPGLEFVFGTDESSRKSHNITSRSKASFVVTDPSRRYTVQLEGDARSLSKQEFEENYAAGHFEKSPASIPFKDVAGQAFFVVSPVWLRFSDCNPKDWELTEFDFERE